MPNVPTHPMPTLPNLVITKLPAEVADTGRLLSIAFVDWKATPTHI
jgi:hypothetical protein